MPLQMAPVEIVLEGLDQKTDALLRSPGKLERATNIEFDKTGRLNKRRGYTRQSLTLSAIDAPGNDYNSVIEDDIFLDAGVFDDELLAFGYDVLYSLGSRTAQLGSSRRFVYRGPTNRGTVRVQHVASSGLTDELNAINLTNNNVYSAFDQGDDAGLVANTHFYRCYVWRNASSNTLDALCVVELEHGQDVIVFKRTVRTGTLAGGNGTAIDCPKILVSGTTFVVHWLEQTYSSGSVASAALHRSTIDMTDIDTSTAWTHQGSVATHVDSLYDAQPMHGSTDFVVVHKQTTGTDVNVRRHNGLGWGNTVFNVNYAQTIAARVLCCSGSTTDGDVAFSFQGTGGAANQLITARVNASDGLGGAQVQSFIASAPTEWGQAAHCRTTSRRIVVAAEGWATSPSTSHHQVKCVQVRTDTAARVGVEHRTLNVAMCSRPWAYNSGRTTSSSTPDPDVYILVSFKSTGADPAGGGTQPHGWDQARYFILNLDFAYGSLIGKGNNEVRGRVVANLATNGSADARVSGSSPAPGATAITTGKRMNHVSSAGAAPQSGPDVKTRTVAAVVWNRYTQRRNTEVQFSTEITEPCPATAGIVGYRFHMEEPWVFYRDATDPAEPSANYKGAYPWAQYQLCKAARTLVVSGGAPHSYDGNALVELGFPYYPEITSFSFDPTGNMEDGIRYYCVTWEWRDDQGQVHRSRPSYPIRIQSTTAAGEDGVVLHIRSMTLSQKDNDHHYPKHGQVNVVVWRTVAGGDIFYRLHGGTAQPYRIEDTPVNNDDAYEILVTDTRRDDTGLAMGDQLPYALTALQGASFLPVSPPASTACAVWQNRVWLASSEDLRELWYSAEILPAPFDTQLVAPEFHFENRYVMPQIGEVVALQPMEDELIIFTRDGIYKLVGQGNSLGVADATYQLSVIHEGTGCINPKSIVLAPPGIFFQSAKGIYLFARERTLDYITAGAAVEDDVRTAGLIRSAVLLEDRHQIRFTGNSAPTGAARVWIYDYFNRQWSRADLPNMLSDARLSAVNGGTAWRGGLGEQLHVVCTQGGLWIERVSTDADLYGDQNNNGDLIGIPIDVLLSWLHLGGIAGLKRIKQILVQMTKPTSGALHLDAAYDILGDYSSVVDETFDWSAPAPDCGKAKPAVQKMSAIQLRLYEDASVNATDTISIHAIVLEAAVKPGLRRVPTTQIGT